MKQLTPEQHEKVVKSLYVLNEVFGGYEWNVKLSPPYVDPRDFVIYRQIIVNDETLSKMNMEDAQDARALGDHKP